MKETCVLKNTIQEYAWGSHTAISQLLGEPTPSEKPQAELWMGAHPNAPSLVQVDGNWKLLPELIEKLPAEILGKRITKKFGGKLPFLLKVLAAAKPLSIQAHPNLDQAKEGFKRETDLGIPLTAPSRNYKDDNHKPEIISALTPFWALNGFRRIEKTISLFKAINSFELLQEIKDLEAHPDSEGLKRFFGSVMTMEKSRQKKAVKEAIGFAKKRSGEDAVFEWMLKLNAEYPGDIGIFSPLFLNLVKLKPGQAMFLDAGRLHAYLDGLGIELMANSDNVLRGGLTPKHIDVPELMKILDFKQKEVEILTPKKQAENEYTYESKTEEFRLSVIRVDANASYSSPDDRSIEIMICLEGRASLKNLESNKTLEIKKGTSLLIPAAVNQYSIKGEATLYKASVP
jgi:mannose-6-phosphate isomerase